MDRTRGKLQHGVRRKTRRQPPGGYPAPDLFHLLVAVQVDKVNREPHPERMDGFAGNNPDTLSRNETAPPQQTFSPRGTVARHLDRGAEHGLPGAVNDSKSRIGML